MGSNLPARIKAPHCTSRKTSLLDKLLLYLRLMKVFAVYANVELTYKPMWLDAFQTKYGSSHPYHITLKQPSYIEEDQIPHLQQQVAAFFSSFRVPDHTIAIAFDTVKDDATDGSIILLGKQDKLLHGMQKKLVDVLGRYPYYEPESVNWERDFRPHLTIAYDLVPELVDQAQSDVRQDDLPRGLITEVTLVVVSNDELHEAATPANLSHYSL